MTREANWDAMIFVFYHIFCNEHALPIVRDQISKLHFSGVYKRCDKIFCFLLGPEIDLIASLVSQSGKKFVIQRRAVEDPSAEESAERFALSCIGSLIKPEYKFLYIHSKGVTKPADENVRKWREMMEYFLMTRVDECIAYLETFDVVGCNYRFWYTPLATTFDDDHFPCTKWDRGRHFSGNMWWCKGAYWLTLPKEFQDDYYGPEMHVGLKKPKFKVLHECRVDQYRISVPLSSYVDL